MDKEKIEKVKSLIRTIPDFPTKGIMFRDLTTAFKNPEGIAIIAEDIEEKYAHLGVTKVVGIEARGFIGGSILAHELGAGFVPLRKPGKLPADTISKTYAKEYGTDTIEIHRDAITPDDVVVNHHHIVGGDSRRFARHRRHYACCLRTGEVDEPEEDLHRFHRRTFGTRGQKTFPC